MIHVNEKQKCFMGQPTKRRGGLEFKLSHLIWIALPRLVLLGHEGESRFDHLLPSIASTPPQS